MVIGKKIKRLGLAGILLISSMNADANLKKEEKNYYLEDYNQLTKECLYYNQEFIYLVLDSVLEHKMLEDPSLYKFGPYYREIKKGFFVNELRKRVGNFFVDHQKKELFLENFPVTKWITIVKESSDKDRLVDLEFIIPTHDLAIAAGRSRCVKDFDDRKVYITNNWPLEGFNYVYERYQDGSEEERIVPEDFVYNFFYNLYKEKIKKDDSSKNNNE